MDATGESTNPLMFLVFAPGLCEGWAGPPVTTAGSSGQQCPWEGPFLLGLARGGHCYDSGPRGRTLVLEGPRV